MDFGEEVHKDPMMAELSAIFEKVEVDKNKQVSLFQKFFRNRASRSLFLRSLFLEDLSDSELEICFNEADTNRDGKIDVTEFSNLVNKLKKAGKLRDVPR